MRWDKGAVHEKDGLVKLRVRVQPRASRNAVRVTPGGGVRVALTAPAVDDAANRALCEFVAQRLGIPKSAIEILRGRKSREKTLALRNVTVEEVRRQLTDVDQEQKKR